MIRFIDKYSLDLFKVESKLRSEGYSGREISLILDMVRDIPAESKEAEELMIWAIRGEILDPEVSKRMEDFGLSFPAALLEQYNETRHNGL